MNVLKAYADASALGRGDFGVNLGARGTRSNTAQKKKSGDFLSISEEAQEMLAMSGKNGISVMPQDATYDQRGVVTRQIDSLQGELRQLASSFLSQPDNQGMAGHVSAMRQHLSSIRAMV